MVVTERTLPFNNLTLPSVVNTDIAASATLLRLALRPPLTHSPVHDCGTPLFTVVGVPHPGVGDARIGLQDLRSGSGRLGLAE